ncbi:class II glutamine amidotransferase, partial [Acinetobacter baumannii]|nr:class II glutamine amidotransferase [Acinetobacter baumannii]
IAYKPGEIILFQHDKPIKKAITQVERLIREEKNPELKRITRADQY